VVDVEVEEFASILDGVVSVLVCNVEVDWKLTK
jgi:hypothetical protein